MSSHKTPSNQASNKSKYFKRKSFKYADSFFNQPCLLVTCDKNREAQCRKELFRFLEEIQSEGLVSQHKELDLDTSINTSEATNNKNQKTIEESIQAEILDLKQHTQSKVFGKFKHSFPFIEVSSGLILINVKKICNESGNLCVLDLVELVFDTLRERSMIFRFVRKLIPISIVCKPSTKNICNALLRILISKKISDKHSNNFDTDINDVDIHMKDDIIEPIENSRNGFDNLSLEYTYAVDMKRRKHSNIDRSFVIDYIGKLVGLNRPVNLDDPDTVVIVQAFGKYAGITSISRPGLYRRLCQFNLSKFLASSTS